MARLWPTADPRLVTLHVVWRTAGDRAWPQLPSASLPPKKLSTFLYGTFHAGSAKGSTVLSILFNKAVPLCLELV